MFLKEFRNQLKFGGWRAALIFAGFRFMNRIMYFDILHTMTLELKNIDSKYLKDPEAPIVGRFLTPEEIKKFSKNSKYQLTNDFLPESLDHGDMCFGFVDGDVLAAYGWYSKKPTRVTNEFAVNFSNDWVYMHHGYTNPDYRGKRLHAIGMAKAVAAFQEQGYRGLVSIVASENSNSLKSVKRMGYELTGKIYLFARLNRYLVYQDKGAKDCGMWLSPRHETLNAYVMNRPENDRSAA
ncbi:GNAT family N-acetyltransferase [Pseudobacteriovorax antillogorgiicola]|uniref:Acetyltransferase (GNAT) family protein n=1 Tax=Pseudobacteriovorax antillogorgiicola TaxID=1513793 RepID=A0A1Y6BU73_9BACT|nr:GNAT family N-acetyltransferase [Pseudobacteriovorax antillogorgiicola]TCS54541.1 hypothetical protein EDD56_10654 [Pseudobacteriovorax antillogorgiicola]SMF18592.1 Acetyltransferase (GNAT) family protein [Pseudobacteriovorax antillogorgiicola]